MSYYSKDKDFSLQHVIAAVNRDGGSLYRNMNLKTDAIIANQNKKISSIVSKTTSGKCLTVINTNMVGVGKNRNIGLLFSDADILILGDDDMVYENEYINIITNAFRALPKADFIIFDAVLKNTPAKRKNPKKIRKIKRVNQFNYRRYGAYQFVFRSSVLKYKNISFSEVFGGGTPFSSGEDTIFMKDCLKNGVRIYAYPAVIATVDQGESSWYCGNNEKFFYDKGALLYNIAPWYFRLLLMLFYSIKFQSNLPIFRRFVLMLDGVRGFKKGLTYEDWE